LTIRKKDKADFSGPMDENMKVDGEMASNMELEHIPQQVVRPSKVNGKRERDSIGSHQTINSDIKQPNFPELKPQ